MDRRDVLRKIAAGFASAAGGLWLAGCRDAGMLRDPPPPVFGPRRMGNEGVLKGRQQAGRPQQRYATPSTDDWMPPGRERKWRFIVLHHSATDWGSADEFDRIHRSLGWDELGYHFVIGNGNGSRNGLVEVGGRWPKQKHGAHCKVRGHPEYNDHGIGICLVGNFETSRPSEAQIASAAKLVSFLKQRYHVPQNRIYGHRQLKPTKCPGRFFPYKDLYSRLA